MALAARFHVHSCRGGLLQPQEEYTKRRKGDISENQLTHYQCPSSHFIKLYTFAYIHALTSVVIFFRRVYAQLSRRFKQITFIQEIAILQTETLDMRKLTSGEMVDVSGAGPGTARDTLVDYFGTKFGIHEQEGGSGSLILTNLNQSNSSTNTNSTHTQFIPTTAVFDDPPRAF